MIGKLYIVATPIGHLADITLRALEVLKSVDVIAAEDTRHSQHLLQHYGIQKRLLAYHDHNEQTATAHLITQLAQGKSIALITDAGTPLISDPGYSLVKAAHQTDITVVPIPGACAAIAALSVSGLPSDRFVFEGFLPAKSAARQKRLEVLQTETRTLIFYETPHRIQETVTDLVKIFGTQRLVTIARELTKKFETIHQTTLGELSKWLADFPEQSKGEFVVMVAGATEIQAPVQQQSRKILVQLMQHLSLKQAVVLTAEITGARKNLLYEWAMEEKND